MVEIVSPFFVLYQHVLYYYVQLHMTDRSIIISSTPSHGLQISVSRGILPIKQLQEERGCWKNPLFFAFLGGRTSPPLLEIHSRRQSPRQWWPWHWQASPSVEAILCCGFHPTLLHEYTYGLSSALQSPNRASPGQAASNTELLAQRRPLHTPLPHSGTILPFSRSTWYQESQHGTIYPQTSQLVLSFIFCFSF